MSTSSSNATRPAKSASAIKITRQTVERLPVPTDGPGYHFDALLKGFGVRVSPQGVKTYFVQGRPAGLGRAALARRVSIGRHPVLSPEEARKRAREILSEMAAGKELPKRSEVVLVSAALDRWLSQHVVKLRPRTQDDYRAIVEKVLRPEFGRLPIGDVNRSHVLAIHQQRADTPRRANYIVACARSFLSFCEEIGLRPIDSNPARRIRLYRENKRQRFLSDEEIGRAAEGLSIAEQRGEISPFAAAALRLALLTGARQGELRNLTWPEVDLERRLLLLRDSKTGQKPIFLSEPAAALLAALPRLAGNPHVFPGARREGGAHTGLSRAWEKARRHVGLDDVRAHDLRHSYASVGAARGHSLPIIGKLLGHAAVNTTSRYAHLGADPVTRASDDIGQRIASLMTKPTRQP